MLDTSGVNFGRGRDWLSLNCRGRKRESVLIERRTSELIAVYVLP